MPDTNSITYRDIETHLACLSYKKGGSPLTTLITLKEIASKAESDKEFFSRCMNIGEVFYHENLIDSAWVYLSKVFHESQNINSKKQAAEWLVAICKAQGKSSEMLEYADFLVPFANQEENQGFVKSQLTEQYKNYVQRKQEHVHKQERKKSIMWAFTIIGCLLVLLSSIAILYYRNRKKKQHLETQIETERQVHKMQQKALSGRLRRSNEELRELKTLTGRQEDSAQKTNKALSFAEEPICRLIMERVNEGCFKSKMDCEVYKRYALDKMNLLDLRLAADRHYGQFTVRLKKAYPELTNTDLDYCCLYLLGLTDADVAALMQRAYNTVTERDGKLRKIIGNSNPLSKTLSEIANGSLSVDL